MPSFQITVTPSRRAAARFIDDVRRKIQKAFIEERAKRGLTQSDVARALGVHRSVINREVKGFKDMTLGRVGELAWALGREATFELREPVRSGGTNHFVAQTVEGTRQTKVLPSAQAFVTSARAA